MQQRIHELQAAIATAAMEWEKHPNVATVGPLRRATREYRRALASEELREELIESCVRLLAEMEEFRSTL